MHPRNIFKSGVKFSELAEKYDFFKAFVIEEPNSTKVTLNFDDRDAVRALSRAILAEYYDLNVDIPPDCLIPRIPLRVNYILWIEDLLDQLKMKNEESERIIGLDIGTGPCAVYALLGVRMNDWKMVGTDINPDSIQNASENIKRNALEEKVKVFQVTKDTFFKEVHEKSQTTFHFTMCNPPFFSDGKDSLLKSTTLQSSWEEKSAIQDEIACEGGEVAFICRMMRESREQRVSKIFTTMVGVKKHLTAVIKEAKSMGLKSFSTTVFHQGKTSRWGLVWSWDDSVIFDKAPPSKPRKPAQFEATFEDVSSFREFQDQLLGVLRDLDMKIERKNGNTFEVKAERNTWSHSRKRRRMQLKQNQQDVVTKSNSPSQGDTPPSTGANETEDGEVQAKVPRLNSHDNTTNGAESEKKRSSLTTSDSALAQSPSCSRKLSTAFVVPASTDSSISKDPCAAQTCSLIFKLSMSREGSNVLLKLHFISGSLGADGLHQVLQYLKNHFTLSAA